MGSGCRSCCVCCSWAPLGLLSPMKGVGNTPFSLWGVSRSGGISEPGQGRAGGPGVRGARGRPGRSCDFCLFPSLRLRDFFPSWDPGAVCSVLSVRFSAGGRGKGDGQKGKPRYRSYSKGEKPPPSARALFSPRLIGNYNLKGFCFSSRLLGRRRRRRFSPGPAVPAVVVADSVWLFFFFLLPPRLPLLSPLPPPPPPLPPVPRSRSRR